MFLLKGHEDLRQDERVVQLFGLVNTLLAGDQETSKRHLGYVFLQFGFYKVCLVQPSLYITKLAPMHFRRRGPF